LELITIKAFDSKEIKGNLWEKLKSVLEHIRDNVKIEGFKLIDPGNRSNDLMDTLETWEREALSNDMKNMIESIDTNSENIKVYFPENPKFKVEEVYENNAKNSATILSPKTFGINE